MNEIQNQYHGYKIVSQYDDATGESTHTLLEIQKASEPAWSACLADGRRGLEARILAMNCWNEVASFPSLAQAIEAAKDLRMKAKALTVKGE